ncbi:MAG: FG-GAP-like repeat-containing protein [Verrucomicrobiota bacterium]
MVTSVVVSASMLTVPAQRVSKADTQRGRIKSPLADRSKLPAALQNVRLDRLSSGALMLLDRGGDLVEWPAASSPLTKSSSPSPNEATVALDPRVGANIRLGSDPAILPPTMRAQAEPHIARAPNNPNLLLATFQEGRFITNGGAVDCGFSVSHNGGLSWSRALIPGLTMTSGGPYFRATDPVAGADANGNLYLCTLAATDTNFTSGVVLVSRSTDGGTTFGAPRVAYRPPNNTLFPDKNWMTINTFRGTPTFGRIFVTFTLFSSTSTEGAPIAGTYSDNGGLTWSPAAFIHPANTNAQGSQPVFLPDGKLAIVYWNFGLPTSPGERLEVVVSNTAGTVFSAPKRIATAQEYQPPGIRSGSFLPSATADRKNGNLYVVYQALSGAVPRILFTKSTNAGTTWTTPFPISNNTTDTAVFNPAIAASPDGRTLTAAFYDNRTHPERNTLVDMFLAASFNGGASWEPNIRLTSVSTDATLAPLTDGGYMLGDYLGIAGSINPNVPAVPVWIDTRMGNPDPFITRIAISRAPPTFDFDADGKTDLSVFRNGVWHILRSSNNSLLTVTFGAGTDKIAPGDYDGDGKTDLAVFRNGVWYISQTSNGQLRTVHFGGVGDLPRPGDFDGDGKSDIALFRPSNGVWYYLKSSTGQQIAVHFGANGDFPLLADFDGDAKTDLAVFRPVNRTWYYLRSSDGQSRGVQFGASTDTPVPGDYDGDGLSDIAVFRPSNGFWYRLNSSNGAQVTSQWGVNGDKPVPGDYDNDGKTDLAIYRGVTWLVRRSADNSVLNRIFGESTDVHVPVAYLP